MSMAKTKKIPMRMCVSCGEMRPKRALVRVVKTAEGKIFLDTTGRQSGRGAYICPNKGCLDAARKARRFEKSFSCRIEDEVFAGLEKALADISEKEE